MPISYDKDERRLTGQLQFTGWPAVAVLLTIVVGAIGVEGTRWARTWRQYRDYGVGFEGTVVRTGTEYPLLDRSGNLDPMTNGYAYVVIRTPSGREEQRYIRLADKLLLEPGDHVIKRPGSFQHVTSPHLDSLRRFTDSLLKTGH